MRKEDEVRLRHMLDAAREVLGFAKGRNRDDLNGDRQLVLALVKAIEIIGEAAFQTSENRGLKSQRFPGRILSACAIASFMPISTSTWMSSGRRCRVTWRPSFLASNRCWTQKGVDERFIAFVLSLPLCFVLLISLSDSTRDPTVEKCSRPVCPGLSVRNVGLHD